MTSLIAELAKRSAGRLRQNLKLKELAMCQFNNYFTFLLKIHKDKDYGDDDGYADEDDDDDDDDDDGDDDDDDDDNADDDGADDSDDDDDDVDVGQRRL